MFGNNNGGKIVTKKSRIRIIPLGGLDEIGKNMTLIEYGNEMIMVDCGMAFPDDDMPGVDLVINDISYVEKNRQKTEERRSSFFLIFSEGRSE